MSSSSEMLRGNFIRAGARVHQEDDIRDHCGLTDSECRVIGISSLEHLLILTWKNIRQDIINYLGVFRTEIHFTFVTVGIILQVVKSKPIIWER